MNTVFLFYILTVVNNLITAGWTALSAYILLRGFLVLIAAMNYGNAYADEKVAAKQKLESAIASAKRKVVPCLLAILALVLIPSRNDIVFIIGGSKLYEIATSARVTGIGDKTLDVVEKYLSDAASGEGKK